MARTFLLKKLFVLLCLVHGLAGVRNLRSYYNSPRLVERNGGNDYYKRYAPTWPSLDSRPLPDWYDKAKVGIFIHWGVFSVPSFGSEWFWQNWRGAKSQQIIEFMKANYKQGFTYQDFAKDFTAEFFDPNQWADLFRRSGARYVVLTSKHHEGYTLWPSEYSFSWNAKDVGPHRDLVGDLAQAVRSRGLIFGLYHSLYEWFNPMYLSDKASGFQNREFVLKKILPEMRELIVKYKPWVLWSDGDWEASDTYWNSTQFLAWLYNDSPVKETVVANDRWGRDIPCKHGDFYTCEDRYNPGVLQKHKWENAMTIDKSSWGFRRNANLSDYLTTKELIKTLVETVSCGGNILINVGPTKEGIITPIFQERLLDLGRWLTINGEAIYESHPWQSQNDTRTQDVWYTTRNNNVYAITLRWPPQNILWLGSPLKLFTDQKPIVQLLGNNGTLQWGIRSGVVFVRFPDKASVINEWAYVLKFLVL